MNTPGQDTGHPAENAAGRSLICQSTCSHSLGESCPQKGPQGAWSVAQVASHGQCAVHARVPLPLEAGCPPPASSDSARGKQCFWASHENQQPQPPAPASTPALSTRSCPSEADNLNQVIPSLCVYLRLFHKTRLHCFSLIFFLLRLYTYRFPIMGSDGFILRHFPSKPDNLLIKGFQPPHRPPHPR